MKNPRSKDPFALRRTALGIIRTVIENKKDIKINDLLIYSQVYMKTKDVSL